MSKNIFKFDLNKTVQKSFVEPLKKSFIKEANQNNQPLINSASKNNLPTFDNLDGDILNALNEQQNFYQKQIKYNVDSKTNDKKLPYNYQLNNQNYNCLLDKDSLNKFCDAVENEGASQKNPKNDDMCFNLSCLYNKWMNNLSDFADESGAIKLGFDGFADSFEVYKKQNFDFDENSPESRQNAKEECLHILAPIVQDIMFQ